ncbi:hypothetical protein KIPB_010498, partial [Kipferlia bialata]
DILSEAETLILTVSSECLETSLTVTDLVATHPIVICLHRICDVLRASHRCGISLPSSGKDSHSPSHLLAQMALHVMFPPKDKDQYGADKPCFSFPYRAGPASPTLLRQSSRTLIISFAAGIVRAAAEVDAEVKTMAAVHCGNQIRRVVSQSLSPSVWGTAATELVRAGAMLPHTLDTQTVLNDNSLAGHYSVAVALAVFISGSLIEVKQGMTHLVVHSQHDCTHCVDILVECGVRQAEAVAAHRRKGHRSSADEALCRAWPMLPDPRIGDVLSALELTPPCCKTLPRPSPALGFEPLHGCPGPELERAIASQQKQLAEARGQIKEGDAEVGFSVLIKYCRTWLKMKGLPQRIRDGISTRFFHLVQTHGVGRHSSVTDLFAHRILTTA